MIDKRLGDATRKARMDRQLEELLDELYARGREHDERQADRLDRWRNVEPDTARLLALLIRALAPRRLLELGTSNGYSTIWLAEAARGVGGSLTSVEIDPARTAQARENLERAGLEEPSICEWTTPARSWPRAQTANGVSSSLTPSAPITPATGPTLCACSRREACWQSTMSSPTLMN
jgi:O-methyltransferase